MRIIGSLVLGFDRQMDILLRNNKEIGESVIKCWYNKILRISKTDPPWQLGDVARPESVPDRGLFLFFMPLTCRVSSCYNRAAGR